MNKTKFINLLEYKQVYTIYSIVRSKTYVKKLPRSYWINYGVLNLLLIIKNQKSKVMSLVLCWAFVALVCYVKYKILMR